MDTSNLNIVSREEQIKSIKAYLAFKIVLINYFLPTSRYRVFNAKKLSKWWRRLSGFHTGFKLIPPIIPKIFPPGLFYRQTHNCTPWNCPYTPLRFRKRALYSDTEIYMEDCVCNLPPASAYIKYDIRSKRNGYTQTSTRIFSTLAKDNILPCVRGQLSIYIQNLLNSA